MTATSTATPIGEPYLSTLASFISLRHNVDIRRGAVEGNKLIFVIYSTVETREVLAFEAWLIIQDVARLYQEIEAEEEVLVEIFGGEEYFIELTLISADEKLNYHSITGREALTRVQLEDLSQAEWAQLSEAEFR
jgi:hypothetical protein